MFKSKSGQNVYVYDERKPIEITFESDIEAKELVENHIEKYIGTIDSVFHELISDTVHIDVYIVQATKERPFKTLITSGMSDLPMNVPEGYEEMKYAELMMFLPADWELSQEAFKDDHNYFPIAVLKELARFPHLYNTAIGTGHTIQNGVPILPYSEKTELCCAMLLPPIILPQAFHELKCGKDKTIYFYNLFLLYENEMQYKMDYGLEAILDKMSENRLNDIVDFNRKNMLK